MRDPIGTELGITADEMTFGQDIITAVTNLHRRVGQEDLLFLAIAVSVQTQTGGNLADVLARLASLMRERITMTLKIKALSAEGRLSAMVSVRHAVHSFWRHPTASQRLFHRLCGKVQR